MYVTPIQYDIVLYHIMLFIIISYFSRDGMSVDRESRADGGGGVSSPRRAHETLAPAVRGNHLSNATCLTQRFSSKVANSVADYGGP